jgi:ubiquinone/menaquinone biosynthesis C-methylase UbiE
LFDFSGKRVADIGCGGGIYAKALAELGAREVIALDYSEEMLKGARVTHGDPRILFCRGDAYATGLPSDSVDIAFNRALIHHLNDLPRFFAEMYRILCPGGQIFTQNRTPEDCLLPGSETHLRGFFFEKFPRLKEVETARRHSDKAVKEALRQVGFTEVKSVHLWEVRRHYDSLEEWERDVQNRTGRSLLHHLNDEELEELVKHLRERIRLTPGQPLVEQDRWTVWIATKPKQAGNPAYGNS